MHYLQGPIDNSLGKIVHYLVPTHNYKSVHDLFNPRLFHDCLIAIITNIPELASHLDSLLSSAEMEQPQTLVNSAGFADLRIRNFQGICETMRSALQVLGVVPWRIIGNEGLGRMVQEFDLSELQVLLQQLFELLIKHHGAVEYITQLPAQDQTAIKDFLQRGKPKIEHPHQIICPEEEERRKLEEQNNELRHLLNSKETDIQKLTLQTLEQEDALQELRQIDISKDSKIQQLKKRLLAYEETDTLFQEKDQQIQRLNRALADLQLSNRLLSSQLTKEKTRLEQRNTELQTCNTQLQGRAEKLAATLDSLSRQKQESEASNKRVIANLKDKIRSLTERVGEVQSQLVESKISRELQDREYSQLWGRYQTLRTQSSLMDNPDRREDRPTMSVSLTSSYGAPRECLRLGEDLIEMDKLEQNAFEEQIMMFESSEDNLKKVQEIVNQNARLKERLNALESKSSREDPTKLKKRMAIMRKRNQEQDLQHKQELDLLVSAFEHLLRTQTDI